MRWFKRLLNKQLTKRSIVFWWQRRTRGWDDSDTWSMDSSLSNIILPRLQRFQKVRRGYPSNMTDEEWENIISEMIWGFQWFAEGKQYTYTDNEEAKRAYNAIELFAKNYGSLWW